MSIHGPRRLRHAAAAALGALTVAVAALGTPAVASGPTVTVTPSRELTDQQVVSVSGSGFPPFTQVQMLECAGTMAKPPKDDRACQGLTLSAVVTDVGGSFTNSATDPSHRSHGYRIFALPRRAFSPYPPVCNATSPCLLYVGLQQNDFSQPHVFVPFAFAGAPSAAGNSWLPATAAVVVALLAAAVLVVARRRRHPDVARMTGADRA